MLLSPNALVIKVITYQSTIKAKCHYITRYTCTHIHKLNNHNITSCNYIIYVAEYTWSYIPIKKSNSKFLFHLLTKPNTLTMFTNTLQRFLFFSQTHNFPSQNLFSY